MKDSSNSLPTQSLASDVATELDNTRQTFAEVVGHALANAWKKQCSPPAQVPQNVPNDNTH